MFAIRGLVAATHTPFTASGELNLAVIEKQAAGLVNDGAFGAFVCGTTGECSSLTLAERMSVSERWLAVAKGSPLHVIVHVGSNCLEDAKALAAHAEAHGAAAVAALSPCYFKPKDVITLAESLAVIAKGCPRTPFYFYDIPSLTNVTLPAASVLTELAKRIGNLNGAKFTNADLFSYQQCLHLDGGKYDLPYGIDEAMLAALALGAKGAVGSGYNFTSPLFNKVIAAVRHGDLETARTLQLRGTRLIEMLIGYSYLPASKVVMQALGVDVGPCRLPLPQLSEREVNEVRSRWEAMKSGIRS